MIRYAHTNLIAADYRRLAQFYQAVFGCVPLPPARDLSDAWLADATGVRGASLTGLHMRLPGHGDRGPTLEIFQYSEQPERAPIAANRPGFGHIAFEVDDVAAVRQHVLDAGGSDVGKTVTADIEGAGCITFTYVADPEGNIIELQRWSR